MRAPWPAVHELVERLDPELACAHGLGPLAAQRLRALGREVPQVLAAEERSAQAANLIAPAVLKRCRSAYGGTLLVLKGPELAARYPGRARRFGDLDLLADDPDAAQAALLSAGFVLEDREWPPPGYDADHAHYHLHPLQLPGLPMNVEIHRRVKWPSELEAPPNEDLFGQAVAACVGVDGLLAPEPHQHAVLLAAHGWEEIPLRTLREVVDIAALLADCDPEHAEHVATQWGFGRAWRATVETVEWVLREREKPLSARLWARHLAAPREPTVVEMHLERLLSPFWLVPPRQAVRRAAKALIADLQPAPGETWGDKRRQVARALLHPLSQKSEHDRRSLRGRWRPRQR